MFDNGTLPSPATPFCEMPMKSLLDFLTSATFGFLLKFFTTIAAAGFGILGIGAKTRDDNGRLTKNGKIALWGIIVSAMLAGAAAVYEFTKGQREAAVERRKGQRLLLAVERGVYPFRGVTTDLTIDITKDVAGVKEYKEALLSTIVAADTNQPCQQHEQYLCSASPEGLRTYTISNTDPLYPKAGSSLAVYLQNIYVEIVMFKPDDNSPNSFSPKSFIIKLDPTRLKMALLHFTPSTRSLQYDVRDLSIPDESVVGLAFYSLADVTPGFISAKSDILGPAVPLNPICASLGISTPEQSAVLKSELLESTELDTLRLKFPYPKQVLIERAGGQAVTCSKAPRGDLILPLPETVDDIDDHGWLILPSKSDLKRYTERFCAAIWGPNS
jgi:hypothetical protein